MKRYGLSVFFTVGLMIGLYWCFVDSAYSVPNRQEDCDFNQVSTSSTSYVVVPDSSVTFNNGNRSRRCVISFSAEALATEAPDRVIIAYSIDGGAAQSLVLHFFT